MSCLLVIISEGVSAFIAKGEMIDRYYNPGNLFSEVHILMTNNDQPDPLKVQRLVGSAKLFLHNFPSPRFLQSLGWRPFMLHAWAKNILPLAKRINPQLIRCHQNSFNCFLAREIKRELGVPYVVSLHINPDEDIRNRSLNFRDWLATRASLPMERLSLEDADLILPVYRPIIPYLERLKMKNYEVAYNVLNPQYLQKKKNYALHSPIRIISVGRQIPEKNPDQLILALQSIQNAELTLVGDGPMHEHLRNVAQNANLEKRVHFVPSAPNDEVCQMLYESDIFATHTEYWEISKSVLEPLLTGLPVVLNRRIGKPVPELTDDLCIMVENNASSYAFAISKLISEPEFREKLGRQAAVHSDLHWSPQATEAKFVSIYRRILDQEQLDLQATIRSC